METAEPQALATASADQPDGRALQRAAEAAGFRVSDRMLETLRAQGLIPRPSRSGYRGRAPIWRYPPGTNRQLLTVLRWREHTKDTDVLRILVWLDGFPAPTADIRASLIRWAKNTISAVDQAIRTYQQDNETQDAVNEIARIAAAKRKPAVAPRRSRASVADRERAIALMIRTFGLGQQTDGDREEQARTIERVLGLTPGRKHRVEGEEPWLSGPACDLLDAADIVALPRLLEAIQDATDSDIDAARQTVVAIFRYLPIMVRFLDAATGRSNYIGLAGMQNLDQEPERLPYLLLVIVAMFRAGWTENLHAVTEALGAAPELAEGMQRILALPAKTLQDNLAAQSSETRAKIARLINAATDGELTLAPRPRDD